MSVRVHLEFRDGRQPVDVPVESYAELPLHLADGVAHFYRDCACGTQHAIEDGDELALAMAGTDLACAITH